MHGLQGEALEAQNARLNERMGDITYKVLVMSGKGGVGKTTVAVNLAIALSMKGYSVGILDTDLHGPNVAKMLGLDGEQLYSSGADSIEPFEIPGNSAHGIGKIKVVSLALSGNSDDEPIIWRGPLKIGVIKQFLADVNWGKLDFLVIDTPPGTGDEPLTVVQTVPNLNGSVVVTTPQNVAILDSRKSINFARKAESRVLGVVENMSGYVCPHCQEVIDLFGRDGGRKAADDMQVPFLGSIPIDKELMLAEDNGKLYLREHPDSGSAAAILEVVDALIAQLGVSEG